jgi:hypothetical protein
MKPGGYLLHILRESRCDRLLPADGSVCLVSSEVTSLGSGGGPGLHSSMCSEKLSAF